VDALLQILGCRFGVNEELCEDGRAVNLNPLSARLTLASQVSRHDWQRRRKSGRGRKGQSGMEGRRCIHVDSAMVDDLSF
jgi:hypothetical protein